MEEKLLISNIKTLPMDSDDEFEQASIEHLAPQIQLETPDTEVQYALRSPPEVGSMITYRVLQVQDTPDTPEYVATSGSFSSTSSSQMLTNGPIYVIGNPESYTTTTSRPIAPRPQTLENSVVVQVKKRDERRRATHNEVERRRRDKINNWIARLAKILPESPQDLKGNGQYDGHSKGGILSKAFEHIIELQASETRLGTCIKENKKLVNAVEQLRTKNFSLENENTQLRELLKKHGIEVK
ncbi:unnamed protein product [Ceutorhynchus assimilis]|uniref:BHLH domain-containing protein n=1 Tax=Ceutorhynchus assimilis TaxID=467358 RepID=A0A9N9MP07_9CUCU|nr:unnamed protein product [Ceutorhynchus assimilis]